MCGCEALQRVGVVSGYSFVECNHCAFIYSPEISQEYMRSLYMSGYHGPEDGAPVTGWATPSFLDPAFDILEDRRPLHILDFGSGQSLIPEGLREEGHRVVTVDMAPPLRPHPDRLTGDLLELGLPREQFDLVYAYQVFEHLPEPLPILVELFRLARPGGLVLIHTDMEVADRQPDFTAWWYVSPPDHCSFFRHRTFEVFIQRWGHALARSDPKCVVMRKASAE